MVFISQGAYWGIEWIAALGKARTHSLGYIL